MAETPTIQRVISEPHGYDGVPFNELPDGLRLRVIKASMQLRAEREHVDVSMRFTEEREPWNFGEYTDVFVMDGDEAHGSYHRVGDRVYSLVFTGMSDMPVNRLNIARAMGFDEKEAQIIREYGHKGIKLNSFQHDPSGPYYGQTIKTL